MSFLNLFKVFFAFLVAFSTSAYAAFDTVPPPQGWSKNPSGNGGLYGGAPSPGAKPVFTSNANWYKYISDIKTAGGTVKVPWYMRMGSSTGAYFAARAFTPAGLGLLALPLVIEWFSQSGISLLYDDNGLPRWAKAMPSTVGNPYHYATLSASTPVALCNAIASAGMGFGAFVSYSTGGAYNDVVGYCSYVGGSQAAVQKCPIGQIWNGQLCIVPNPALRPLTKEEFEEIVTPLPMPIDLPEKLPFGLPVDDPIFNPYPAPNGVPQPVVNPDGLPRPAPAPRPNPDPYPFVEPGTKITPAPDPDDKWKVEKKPVDTPKPDLTPTPKPTGDAPVPDPNKPGTTDPEKDPGLCAMFPDILACEKLGSPIEPVAISNIDVPISITPVSGIGNSNGTCPADKQITLALVGQISVSYSFVCQYVVGLRPVIIALAWMTAAFTLLGFTRKD